MKIRRRIMQILMLLLFIFLFLSTKYNGKNFLQYPVNIFLKLDPLIALGIMISSRTFISMMAYSFFFILATFILGRFFCGWFCPLGTVLDIFDYIFISKKTNENSIQWEKIRNIKYYILIFVLLSSVINVQLIWLFDPISILFRTFTTSLFPLFDFITRNFFDFLYWSGMGTISEPIYIFIKKAIFSIKPPVYELNLFILSFFIVILFLDFLGKRFWCKVICPLGAMFEFISLKSLVNKNINKEKCNQCDLCNKKCKMQKTGCIMCFNCVELCPTKAIDFEFSGNEEKPDINISRRNLITSSILSALILPGFKLDSLLRNKNFFLIRPPGALPEDKFLSQCTRCGDCMRVCITNGLQPTLFEAGTEGLWSPKLVPRLGYCEYNCSLCGQACPTGAIQELSLGKKHQTKIGLAYFDRNRCLPWHKNIDCLVCEEHCPVPDKAIKFKLTEVTNIDGTKVMVKQPHIIEKLCIGCGICENKCPVEKSAIIVGKTSQNDNFI
ncbi:4Fe-4S binding protein [Candidatus Poribacteria bacterium]|nr:4Fe-4S binding protein [Candidatus Poribacteria bacterium]